MPDNTIPSEDRLFLYMSARYLQELKIALRLGGVPARYERPRFQDLMLPRLLVRHPEHGEMSEVLVARAWQLGGSNPDWWFEWWQWWNGTYERICRTIDMNAAARIITEQLYEEPP